MVTTPNWSENGICPQHVLESWLSPILSRLPFSNVYFGCVAGRRKIGYSNTARGVKNPDGANSISLKGSGKARSQKFKEIIGGEYSFK